MVAKFTIKDGQLILHTTNKSENKPESWHRMVESLEAHKELSVLEFYFNAYEMGGTNPDILEHLLEFALYVGFMCRFDVSKSRVKEIILRIIDDPYSRQNENKNRNKLQNFFKFLRSESKNRLRILINDKEINWNTDLYKQIPTAYFPALVLDDDLQNFLFREKIWPLLMNQSPATKPNKPKGYLVEFIKKELTGGFGKARSQDLLSWLETKEHLTIIEAAFCAMYFSRHRERKRSGYDEKQKNEDRKLLDKSLEYTKSMVLGIREICDNIGKHTDDKLGMFYLRVHSKRNAQDLGLPAAYKVDSENWLEISVLDFNREGILETNNTITTDKSISDMHLSHFGWKDARCTVLSNPS